MESDSSWIIPIVLFAIMAFGFLIWFIYSLFRQANKEKTFTQQIMSNLSSIDYTVIITSSNGESGTISTFSSQGGAGLGSYGTGPKTKFLVVYKSGVKQVILLDDNSPLFNEFVRRLK